jgi:hypothetical protein
MAAPKTVIALFIEQRDGYYEKFDDYDLEALGGEVPAVGDLIVDPGVLQGRDRSDPGSRSVHEVAARYFLPRTTDSDYVFIALLVKERQGRREEINILGP